MLRVGIIGCGKIAELRHAPEYTENPACKLVGFYDFVPERAQALADQFDAMAFGSVQALLDSVDAVSVCSANNAHAAATIQALEAGRHVLCEKPMATTLADCEAMVAAARNSAVATKSPAVRIIMTWTLLRLLSAAAARGARSYTLEVRPSNDAAIALYRKFDFIVEGRSKRYYAVTGEDALIMWRHGESGGSN